MWIALFHALLCSLTGAALAATAGVAWQRYQGEIDAAAVAALAAGGAIAAGSVGGVLRLVYQLRLRRLETRLPATKLLTAQPPVAMPATMPRAGSRRKQRLIARISANHRWDALSAAACQLLRQRARSLRGRPIYDALHPEDFGIVDKALRRALGSGKPQTLVCRFLVPMDMPAGAFARTTFRSDTQLLPPLDPATIRYVRLQVVARAKAGNGAAHYLCRFADLSPRMELQRELRRARLSAETIHRRYRRVSAELSRLKESYSELYHNAPVMYFRLDVDGRLIAFNNELLRTLSYERNELKGHMYADLLAPVEDEPPPEPRGVAPFEEGEVNTRWRRQDGTGLDVWIRTVADRDEHGAVVRFRSAALDLTEKNRLANELRARGDELERTNQRLRMINAELEDFTRVVSHDLREPLRTLQTYSKLLYETCSAQLGTDGFQYIDHLIKASRRLGLLIDDLLHLSQAGRATRAAEPFDLIDAVATARTDLVDLIQRKEATVLTEGSLPRVVADRSRITQVLTNLIANGLKYNQNAQPQVVITARAHREPGSVPAVLVSVRDNGIGIDPAFHEEIFKTFRRLHRSDEYEGTGAGLAICKTIIEAHQGRLWVESQPGAGATFYFTLPHTAAPSAPAQPAESDARRSGRLPPPLATTPPAEPARSRAPRPTTLATGPEIVLVEDDAEAAYVIQLYGKQVGLTFLWFTTAEAAWEHLQTNQPDVLLFDINLPGMSGVELCRRVRGGLPALRETPVVLFVSEPTPERLAELHAAGADHFLSKELLTDPPEWQRRLQQILNHTAAPATIRSR